MISAGWNELLRNHALPAAVVDLDRFDENLERIRAQAEKSGKTIRIASKSIRVPFLMNRILEKGRGVFQGLLTYSTAETVFLYRSGFRDLVIAYPTLQKSDLLCALPILKEDPSAITFMVDSEEHLEFLSAESRAAGLTEAISICIDLDMSYRPCGIHLGVQRSPIRSPLALRQLLDALQKYPSLRLRGLMGYEAQIAGLADRNPFSPLLNPLKRLIKNLSIPDVRKKRKAAFDIVQKHGLSLQFFNGGGSGSLSSTLQEATITEATAGSGFLQSHLFDYYQENRQEGALYVALRVSRKPQSDMITCHGGGIIGSGEIAREKAMIPVFPAGLALVESEGCGEVQTPLRTQHVKETIRLGDAIFFRPAKAGEPLERFKSIVLISGGKVQGEVPTYRGLHEEFQ
jgi:D-serine deaminase-like pyridoxal phosphate-dependent protein